MKINDQTIYRLSDLKNYLYKNNYSYEYNLLKQSMPRPYGSLFDVESGRHPSEEFDSEKVTVEGARGMRVECEEKVCWYGHTDRMIRVDVDYVYPIIGNQFYPDLVKRIEDKIRSSSYLNPARLYCGYCNVKKIKLIDIKESLEYYEYGEDEFQKPLTTGDEELDKYVKDKEEYLENWQSQYDKEEAESLLEKAIANNEGDLGKYIYQIRNGNHRVFAAKNAGEKYIWINLSISDYENLKGDSPVYEDYTELKKHFGFI